MMKMRYSGNIGKYQLGQTIGEGTFAKVKLAKNTINGQHVAVKIIDKNMVIQNKLMHQASCTNLHSVIRMFDFGVSDLIFFIVRF